jgi:hypothetical protein
VVLLYNPNPALQAVVYPMQASSLFQDEKEPTLASATVYFTPGNRCAQTVPSLLS